MNHHEKLATDKNYKEKWDKMVDETDQLLAFGVIKEEEQYER